MSAYLKFDLADKAWSAELRRIYGKQAGDVRYTRDGKGALGTRLRELHDAFCAARDDWYLEVGLDRNAPSDRELLKPRGQ